MRIPLLLALAVMSSGGVIAPSDGDFRMTVMDVFTITDQGVVVTGIVEGGPVRLTDVVCLRPAEGETRELTVTAIQMSRRTLEVADPGAAVGLLFTGIERAEIRKGDTLTGSCG
ncbi:MAG: EF-Tu/IF-2/RF-3 family GTPase [Gemmatimonadota bacterium]|nr:EF-Tu/IF-2/RF-3 family GTPase [Gemmatimonadota bacterium]MDH3423079.1 EF-Tu/IF-2/RF-3 family GTPase [Gemmatimonadota bacterium]